MENVRKYLPDEDEQKIDLYAYWKIFWRKKFYLFVPLLISAAISVYGVYKLTPIYESFTVISVEDQNVFASTMRRYTAPIEEQSRVRNRQFRSMIETRLQSRDFLELIIKDLGLNRSPDVRRMLEQSGSRNDEGIDIEERVMRHFVSLLREKVKVSNPNPGFFQISVFDTDPETSYTLSRRVSEKYIEVTQQAQLLGYQQAGAFSDEQLAIYREKLETSEKELSRVQRELQATDVESNPVNSVNIHLAEARLRSLKARIGRGEIELKGVRERLNTIFGMIPSTDQVSTDEAISNIENQLFAEGDEQMIADLGGAAPVQTEESESTDPWEELRRRLTEIIRIEYSDFSSDVHPLMVEYYFQRYVLDYYRDRERKLSGYINQFRRNMERRPMLQREFDRLGNEVETNRTIYQAFLESKTSAQISEAVQSTNLGLRITVIENAERPFVPVKPNKLKIILLAVAFGGACGIGAILITEYMDDSFRTIEEVQRILKLPVLGTIPKTVAHFAWEKRKRGRLILMWIVGLFIFVSAISGALYLYAKNLQGTSIGVQLDTEGGEGR